MPEEIVYSSAATLRTRKAFIAATSRDLRHVPAAAWPLFVRGLQAQYRQTSLRWVGTVVPGIIMAAVWVYLKHVHLISIAHTNTPYLAFVLSGVVLWQLFFDSLNAPLQKLIGARSSLTTSRLPHEAYILAGIFEALFDFCTRLIPFAVVFVLEGISLRWSILLVPVGALCLVALGVALGLLLAPAGLLYRDVGKILTLGAGFWFFLTPVVYPQPPRALAPVIVRLNPVTPLLVTTRDWLTSSSGTEPVAMLIVCAVSLVVLCGALFIYRLAQPHLVARL